MRMEGTARSCTLSSRLVSVLRRTSRQFLLEDVCGNNTVGKGLVLVKAPYAVYLQLSGWTVHRWS